MTANRGLFVRQVGTAPNAVGTTPKEARLAMAGLVAENAPGTPRQGLLNQGNVNVVTGNSGTMSYDVSPINPVIVRSVNDGVYMPTYTGITNVPTTPAPGSGARIDLIWVKQNDAEAGDPDNFAIIGVTQGTAGGARPTSSVPAGAYIIASARVSAGAVTAQDAAVVITQEWVHTSTRGAAIPIRSLTERNDITQPAIGQIIYRTDFKGWREVWDGTTWQHPDNFAEHSGYITVPTVAAGATGSGSATFPAGKFTLPPIISLTPETYRFNIGTSVPTTSGVAIAVLNDTTATTGQPVRVHYRAVQATPTSAAG